MSTEDNVNTSQKGIGTYNVGSNVVGNKRYFINGAFYKPGGPVFLMTEGSDTANRKWISMNNTWLTYAERLGALCLLLEHRFYGHSQPTGDLSTASLRYLSSRQALADIVNFRTKVAKTAGLTRNKWVVFGGSYGGSLAVWSRIKHPDLFAAAVGSSAPMLAKVNFYEYLEGVQNSLGTHNKECLKAVKEAYDQVVEMLKLPKYYSKLESDFMLCKNFKFNSVMDTTFFLERLVLLVATNVQHNMDKKKKVGILRSTFKDTDPDPQRGQIKLRFGGFYVLYGEGNQVFIRIEDFCDIMTNTSLGSPYYRLVRIVHSVFKETFSLSFNADYDGKMKALSDSSINHHMPTQGRQWLYQSCTEFGFFKTTDSKNQPFTGVPLSYFVKPCSDVFGPEFNYDSLKTGVMSTNMYYGGFNVRGSKIIFSNGSFDPWHTLGITKDISKDLPAVFIKGAGHCSEMFRQKATDSAELIQAREKIFHILQKWLKE
ncbi:putative serine protease K12H4.7 [Trichechus manatus latirostris]|uniref:Serine protease K12H4.7 n=1 Tax=Trichechus manatus latirostris TaxID=127582 RepID=A0A2Y9RL71_TRIMA|nr:putative serine protease K12H4.7 [Trichechus manatus latirostris]